MARSSSLLSISALLLLMSPITAAQPARHRHYPRGLHGSRDATEHNHVANAYSASPSKNDAIYTEYLSKLALRDTALEIFRATDPAGSPVRSELLLERQIDTKELQEKLDELEAAFQSLLTLLATQYGTTSSWSTTASVSSTAMATSVPVITIEPSSTSEAAAGATVGPPTSMSNIAPASSYTFRPMSSSNVAVYYGQTDLTSAVSLTSICADPSVDIVILGFLNNFFSPYPSGFPTLNLGPNCWAANPAQVAMGASQLIDCVSDGFAAKVAQCQNTYGKKVLLSLGGAQGYSDTRIPDDQSAALLADTIWGLFLGGTGNKTLQAIRPFGQTVLDGIDIDNEDPANSVYLPTLIKSLRSHFAADASKPYFLSAAPQCPRPDQSIPLGSMQTQIDFVMPQFYNNPSCNLNSGSGFTSSLEGWARDLSGVGISYFGGIRIGGFQDIGNGVTSPRLLIGAPTFANAGSGFVEGTQFESIVEGVKSLNLSGTFEEQSPLGGFMFWDGAYGEESTAADGVNESYMDIVKKVLD